MAIRLIVCAFELPGHLNPRLDHFPFGYETGRVARAIAEGRGFSDPFHGPTGPTALLPPLYTYLLAGVFKLFGVYTQASAIVILFLDSLFSALTCWPIYYAARRCFGAKAALYSAWAWALLPHAIYLSAQLIWDQNLTTLFAALIVLAALHLEDSTSLGAWAGFGLLAGLGALTNPIVLAPVPFLIAWCCYRLYRQGKVWFPQTCVAGLVLVAALVPWTIRNYEAFHRFIPMRDGFWLELYVGNTGANTDFKPEWAHPAGSPDEWHEYRRLGEQAYIEGKKKLAIEFIKSHPRWFVVTTLRRISFIWTGIGRLPGTIMVFAFDPDEPYSITNILAYTTLTVLMLLGLLRALRERNSGAVPFALVLLTLPLVYYITHPDLRFRHPMDPAAVILAVYAITGGVAGTLRPSESEIAEVREIKRALIETNP